MRFFYVLIGRMKIERLRNMEKSIKALINVKSKKETKKSKESMRSFNGY